MQLKITIPDDTYEAYVGHAKGMEGNVPTLLASQLERFKRVSPIDRIIVVDAVHRAALETILPDPSPQIRDAKDLVERVDMLAHIEIGGVAVRFSSRDLEAIRGYADKANLSVQEAIEQTVVNMKGRFMEYVPEATEQAAMAQVEDGVQDAGVVMPVPDLTRSRGSNEPLPIRRRLPNGGYEYVKAAAGRPAALPRAAVLPPPAVGSLPPLTPPVPATPRPPLVDGGAITAADVEGTNSEQLMAGEETANLAEVGRLLNPDTPEEAQIQPGARRPQGLVVKRRTAQAATPPVTGEQRAPGFASGALDALNRG